MSCITAPFHSISQSRITWTSEFTNSNACHMVTGRLMKCFQGWDFQLFSSIFLLYMHAHLPKILMKYLVCHGHRNQMTNPKFCQVGHASQRWLIEQNGTVCHMHVNIICLASHSDRRNFDAQVQTFSVTSRHKQLPADLSKLCVEIQVKANLLMANYFIHMVH